MRHRARTILRLERLRAGVLAELHHELLHRIEPLLEELGGRFAPYTGFRGREEQESALARGNSGAAWGQSPHNFLPALALDVVLHPARVAVAPVKGDEAWPNLWDNESPAALQAWADLELAAARHGLERVRFLNPLTDQVELDLPHLQLPHWRSFLPPDLVH